MRGNSSEGHRQGGGRQGGWLEGGQHSALGCPLLQRQAVLGEGAGPPWDSGPAPLPCPPQLMEVKRIGTEIAQHSHHARQRRVVGRCGFCGSSGAGWSPGSWLLCQGRCEYGEKSHWQGAVGTALGGGLCHLSRR